MLAQSQTTLRLKRSWDANPIWFPGRYRNSDWNRISNKSCWTWRITLIFGFDVDILLGLEQALRRLFSKHATKLPWKTLLLRMCFVYLEKALPHVLVFIWNFLYLYEFQARNYHLKYDNPTLAFPRYMMLLTGCGMFEMWDYRDVGSLGCGMLFGKWDVWDVGCSGWGMFGMKVIWDVECLWCRIFTALWDVGLKMSFVNYTCLVRTFQKSMIILSPLQPAYLNVLSREVPQSYPYKKEFCKYKANLHVKNATLLK